MNRSANEARSTQIPMTEWVTAAVGAVFVLAAVGYMAWYGLAGEEGPPVLEVTADAIHDTRGGHLVEFTVRNSGNATAASVVVSGTVVNDDGDELARGETTLDYVPEQSERRGGIVLPVDPRGRLALRAEGYSIP